ncbi:hypothetical protein [Fretibacter rubidus]|uniref:hypothetical protein n=1 Tax=Fretibacter rubidus TaxID=570162 RepID=UPI00352B25AC
MIATFLITASVSLALNDTLDLDRNDVRVKDVVDMRSLSPTLASRISDKAIATRTGSQAVIKLTRSDIADLVRKRVPVLSDIKTSEPDDFISIHFPKIEKNISDRTFSCYELMGFVPEGTALTRENLRPVSCDAKREKIALRYDKPTRLVRTIANANAGQYLGRVSVPKTMFADKGDPLTLQVIIGPVKIEKKVWALQPAHAADKIFVKDREGTVLRVPVLPRNQMRTELGGIN